MGCTALILSDEGAVKRCKEMRGLMEEAVFGRHQLATAHADYINCLGITGKALTSFVTCDHILDTESSGTAMEERDREEGADAESGSGMVARHRKLKAIVDVVRENFDMAAAAGDQVTRMLENGKGLCSTLDRLLVLERKLSKEISAREAVKIQHEKKLNARLQSRIDNTSEAVTTTSISIIQLINSDLVPQLVQLCHELMSMWRLMHQYHEVQNNTVQLVRNLGVQSARTDPTSVLHWQATRELEAAIADWHYKFCRLVKSQQEFIQSLQGWFKHTLSLVGTDNAVGNRETFELYTNFCDEWKFALDRVPDRVASEAIKSFMNFVREISEKQYEELKIKDRTDNASKEYMKRALSVKSPEKGSPDNLAARVEDALVKHSRAIEVTRTVALKNLQMGLPGVFKALTSFSASIFEALQPVCELPMIPN